MEEYNIWKKIFEEDDEITLGALIELVIKDEEARELVLDNLLILKNRPKQVAKVSINIDKEAENLPVDEILAQVSKDIFKQMNE